MITLAQLKDLLALYELTAPVKTTCTNNVHHKGYTEEHCWVCANSRYNREEIERIKMSIAAMEEVQS